jgi:hypothetical protein
VIIFIKKNNFFFLKKTITNSLLLPQLVKFKLWFYKKKNPIFFYSILTVNHPGCNRQQIYFPATSVFLATCSKDRSVFCSNFYKFVRVWDFVWSLWSEVYVFRFSTFLLLCFSLFASFYSFGLNITHLWAQTIYFYLFTDWIAHEFMLVMSNSELNLNFEVLKWVWIWVHAKCM